MDVTLRIRNIQISEKFDTIEFVYKNTCSVIKDVVNFTIFTLHDFLFEKVTLRLKSRGAIWDKYLGVIHIQNSSYYKIESKKNTERVLSGDYVFRTDFYDLKGLKVIGEIIYDFKVRYNENGDDFEQESDNFVQKMFNLFLDQQKSVLLANFKSVIDDFLIGSHSCKINFLLGVYLMEKYTADVHYKMTKNLKFDDIKHLKKLEVRNLERSSVNIQRLSYKEKIKTTENVNRNFEFEKLLLGSEKTCKYSDVTDFSTYYPILGKKLDRQFIINNINLESTLIKENEEFNIYKMFDTLFNKEKFRKDALDLLEASMLDMSNVDNISSFRADKSEDVFPYMTLDIEKLFDAPKKCIKIKEVLSNDGYIISHKSLLIKLIDFFYFAIGSYGNSWATAFCKKRKVVDDSLEIDSNRKSILEFLNIENNRLLSVQMAQENIPEYLLFFDKDNNRLVLSFKGTSTSEEALKDLNCRYTKFYDGFAHKGIKHMACEYVKHKTKELFELAENCKTKNILITGHSLGASIGILVHLIYERQDISKILNITTLAFCPAPVVSYNIAKIKHDRLYIISYGNDFVPRLNYGSFSETKYAACSLGNKLGFLSSTDGIDDNLEIIREFNRKHNKFPKLYCPGDNYHFKRIIVIKQKKKISLIVYKKVELEFFESMIIIKHATMHHMLPHLLNVFEQGIKDWDEIDNE